MEPAAIEAQSRAHRSARLLKHVRLVYISIFLDCVDILDRSLGSIVARRGSNLVSNAVQTPYKPMGKGMYTHTSLVRAFP